MSAKQKKIRCVAQISGIGKKFDCVLIPIKIGKWKPVKSDDGGGMDVAVAYYDGKKTK